MTRMMRKATRRVRRKKAMGGEVVSVASRRTWPGRDQNIGNAVGA
jgi:hypothetical protein